MPERISYFKYTARRLKSELFGHEKGTLTDDIAQKTGKFEMSSGGTKTIKVNIPSIAATNRDLEAEVERKTFRHDLLYRLEVATIVPPLCECRDEIVQLTLHRMARYSQEMVRYVRGISAEAERVVLRLVRSN